MLAVLASRLERRERVRRRVERVKQLVCPAKEFLDFLGREEIRQREVSTVSYCVVIVLASKTTHPSRSHCSSCSGLSDMIAC